jgi:hypothetical protein
MTVFLALPFSEIPGGTAAMKRLFTAHPATVGETYVQHMGQAFGFAATMLGAACACFLHGLFPWLFVSTGSRTIATLHDRMIRHRQRQGDAAADLATAPRS